MSQMTVSAVQGNDITINVVPVPRTEIKIDRSVAGPPGPTGPAGPPGTNTIGGYPITIDAPANRDALMWLEGIWVNINQIEITDGGNF